jgi:hypothetical protein
MVFLVASFLLVSPPMFYTHFSSPLALHALPISSTFDFIILIVLGEQCKLRHVLEVFSSRGKLTG